MKHIGILATTAEGAALTYRQICALSMARLGGHRHPEISLHAFSFSEYAGSWAQREQHWPQLVLRSAAKLRACGADFLICPANTTHEVHAQVAPQLPIPWLHIADPVRRAAQRQGLQRLLLLGTQATMQGRVYEPRLAGSDIELLKPDAQEIEQVHRFIMEELVAGVVTQAARSYFRALAAKYRQQGAQAVVLGCTELPLVLDAEAGVPLLDSTALLAHAAVEYALGEG
ncbi:MAG: amino acid racemase [Comamonadaceae bacterium]|nr:amino acid racemase [Comamonadaceae bacterium]